MRPRVLALVTVALLLLAGVSASTASASAPTAPLTAVANSDGTSSLRWDLRRVTTLGQEVTLTGYARADAYNARDVLSTAVESYRGGEGFNGRAIGALAADVRWPFVGPFLGGTQRLVPRLQVVASPKIANLSIPNEDSRAVDLEDSNLFALNRFPGHDRWEDGLRVTYGVDWALDLPGVAIRTNVGQSYRLDDQLGIFPPGTGLAGRLSDFVGRRREALSATPNHPGAENG